jgi:hypothetical protein
VSASTNQKAYGELAQALSIIFSFMSDKGQIPALREFLILNIIQYLINAYTSAKISINWDKIVKLSINAPALTDPLWLRALREIARLGAQTNIITELAQRKPLVSLSK